MTPYVGAICGLAAAVFGLDLLLCVFLFPLIKGWNDPSLAVRGYAALGAAVVLLAILHRSDFRARVSLLVSYIPHRAFLSGLFVVSFGLRLLGLFIYQLNDGGAGPELMAWNLSQGTFVGNKGLEVHYPPGYYFFAASVYWAFGRVPLLLEVVNCLIDALTSVLVVTLAARVWGNVAGRWAGMIYCLNPTLVVMTHTIYYPPLLALLLTLIALSARKRVLLLGGLSGVASLTKPIFLPMPLLAGLVGLASGRSLPKAAARAAGVALVMSIVILPWTYRNYAQFGRFVLVSANGGWVLWWGANSESDGVMQPFTAEQRQAREAELIDLDRRLGAEAMAWIRANPWRFVALIPTKQAHTWGTEAASLRTAKGREIAYGQVTRAACQVYYLALALAAGYTLFRNWRRIADVPESSMAALLLVLGWTIHSVFIGWSFYHLPFLPLLTIFAAGSAKPETQGRHSEPRFVDQHERVGSGPQFG